MQTWFAKVVEKNADTADGSENSTSDDSVKTRRLVHAPLITSESQGNAGENFRIKAKIESEERKVDLMVDHAIVENISIWCGSPAEAAERSPLAQALFDAGQVESVLIFGRNVTVIGDIDEPEFDENHARQFGQIVRSHLENGRIVVTDHFAATIPSEEEIRARLQETIEQQINPGIAGHSGEITLTRVTGNSAYIKMGGGCQGCAASSITLKQGVEQTFRTAMPYLGALFDETDHNAGSDPFYR